MTTLPDPVSPDSPNLLTEPVDYSPPGRRSLLADPRTRGVLAYLTLCLVIGALCGVLWHGAVDLPVYTVGEAGKATTTERGITQFFATDGWYCAIGAVVGASLGWLGWRWFRRIGWPVALLVFGASLMAGMVAWAVGEAMGPGNFDERIWAARAGERVPIQFQLHSHIALLVWPFCAIIPVLLASSLGADGPENARTGWVQRLSDRSARTSRA